MHMFVLLEDLVYGYIAYVLQSTAGKGDMGQRCKGAKVIGGKIPWGQNTSGSKYQRPKDQGGGGLNVR